MLTRKELQEDNEILICLLQDVIECCEEQGAILPVEILERVDEFLILDEDEDKDADVIEIKPAD